MKNNRFFDQIITVIEANPCPHNVFYILWGVNHPPKCVTVISGHPA